VKKIFIAIFSFFLLQSCVIEIEDFVQPKFETFIAFEGGLTNQSKILQVRIYRTSPAINGSKSNIPQRKANPYIIDDKGFKIELFQTKELGLYESKLPFMGIVGNKYKVVFNDDAGNSYESDFEEILKPTPIEKVYYEATLQEKYPIENALRGGFEVYFDFKDDEKNADYYKIDWIRYKKLVICLNCFGEYSNDFNQCFTNPQSQTVTQALCSEDCWEMEFGKDFNLFSDELINGNKVKKVPVRRVPYLIESPLFSEGNYYIEVNLKKISRTLYNSYRLQREQTQNVGTLFDVPTLTQFNQNIKCINKPENKVIGFFEVASISKNYSIIDLTTKIVGAVPKINSLLLPNRVQVSNITPVYYCPRDLFHTTKAPLGWID
jgi:hypothetical protein